MKRTWIDQLLGTAGEWLRPWATVDPDPAGESDGGGGADEVMLMVIARKMGLMDPAH